MKSKIFINRRNKNTERREEEDPCKELDIDIYHLNAASLLSDEKLEH